MPYLAPTYFAPTYWPPGLGGSGVEYDDLIAACIAELQDDAAVVAAFGEAASTPKFFGAAAAGRPDLPYLVFGEPNEQREYSSEGNYISHGQVMVNIYAGNKVAARTLADQAAGVLNDSPLRLANENLMRIRATVNQFNPISGSGPDSPAVQHRVVTLDYLLSGQI